MEKESLNSDRHDVAPYFKEQRFCFRQTVGIHEFPVIEPQTSPEVVHEHRKTGHNGKYTPWATEFISTTRCETAEKTREEYLYIRVVFIEFLVPLLTLIGDFYEPLFFCGLCRPLTHGI